MPPLRLEIILDCLRHAQTADYSARQELFKKAALATTSLCRKLTRADAERARPVFFAVLEMQLSGGCVPQCCDASYVRRTQIGAKYQVLATWRRIDPQIVRDISPSLMHSLVVPTSNLLALVALELLIRSPEACNTHLDTLLQALEHPRWQVVECAARGLGKIGPSAKSQTAKPLLATLRHAQWQVRAAAVRALGRVLRDKHERIERLAQRDVHSGVRYAARKVLGLSTRDLAAR